MMHRSTKILAILLIVCAVCGAFETAFAKVDETVALPVTGMKVTEDYASGDYYANLLKAMKESADKNPQERFVLIAESQIGYTKNSYKGKFNREHSYIEYGNHRDYNGNDWSAAFVSWCAEAAGLGEEVLKRSNSAGQWGRNNIKTGEFRSLWSDDFANQINEKPEVGDLVLLMGNENEWKKPSAVGIVTSVGAQNEDGSWKFIAAVITAAQMGVNKVGEAEFSTNETNEIQGPIWKRQVRKFQGFYTPNWGEAKPWTKDDVSVIDASTPESELVLHVDFLYEGVVEGWPVERSALKVTVTFEDGKEEEVTDYSYTQSGLSAGEQTLTVTYGTKSKEIKVNYFKADEPPLPDLVLPEHTVKIEEEAFMGTSCQYVYCGEELKSIGTRAFADCKDLVMIYIPQSVKDIADIAVNAFEGNSDNFWISGSKGSAAERYANKYAFGFWPAEQDK